MSATLRLVLSTIAGFLFGFLVGAFMYFETVDPAVSQNVVLMGFVWILFSWVGARLSYSITRDTIEKEEWEAAAQRRYDLNRMG
jgi:prolipoprotein diacylglyceryltransferase